MDLDPGSTAIVRLAWARLLGLDDATLNDRPPGRILHVDEWPGRLTVVRLLGSVILRGPEWALAAAEELSDDELTEQGTLLRLSRDHGGRGTGVTALYFADEGLDVVPSSSTVVSSQPQHARELEALCPPDDVTEVGLSDREKQYVLLTEREHSPVSGAGYDIWEGILADLSALTAPETRKLGLGSYIMAIALEEALNDGLVPQMRVQTSNTAGLRTAETLGFVDCGTSTSIVLD